MVASINNRKQTKRQVGASYVTTIISIMLVLFTLGFLGLILLQARSLSRYIKENIGFEIVIKKGVKDADIFRLQKMLDARNYVKSTEFITKDEAASRLKETLGNDFISFLGEENNPLLPSLEVRFNADWASPDSLKIIEKNVLKNSIVKEVYYHKSLVDVINKNISRIGIILLAISLILIIISVALINNTIRLAIFAKRHTIKSMQLVGATNAFIRRPFVQRAVLHGALSALLALLLLSGVTTLLKENIPELQLLENRFTMLMLYLSVLMLGIIISAVSTWLAVTRYLKTGSDKLYG